MDTMTMITMRLREISRLKTIQAVAEGDLRAVTAVVQLGLSRRQIDRLVERYRDDGPSGLVSKKRGLRHHQLPASAVDLALSLIRDRYSDFGPTLACEKLRERHGILLAKETVCTSMTDAGLWIPRKQRPPSIYQPRNRRSCVGELIQIDGSDHRWFEDRAPVCTLLVYIDDATSQLMYLHIWCANTSQAKGRVERANLTLEDRLVKELRLEGFSSMAAANAYVPTFMADFNRRFAKPPRSEVDVHWPVRQDEDLDRLFTVPQLRKVSHVLTLQYDKAIYLLADTSFTRTLIDRYIDVFDYPDGRVEIRVDGNTLPYVRYDHLPQVDQGASVENKRLGHTLQVAIWSSNSAMTGVVIRRQRGRTLLPTAAV